MQTEVTFGSLRPRVLITMKIRTQQMTRDMSIALLMVEDLLHLNVCPICLRNLFFCLSYNELSVIEVNVVENPDTSVLDKSDLRLLLSAQTGISPDKPLPSIPKLLANREIGVTNYKRLPSSHMTFGLSHRCKLSTSFLPNKISTVEQYPSKGLFKQTILYSKIDLFDSLLWILLKKR